MAMKVVGPLMPKGMVDWGTTLRKFLAKKQIEMGEKAIREPKKPKMVKVKKMIKKEIVVPEELKFSEYSGD